MNFATAVFLLLTASFAQAPPRLYAVRLSTGPAWEAAKTPNEQAGMREHSQNIARLRTEGTLVLGARFGELGLLVLRVPDEAAVRQALAPDPTIATGVFKVHIDVFSPFAHGSTAFLMTPEAIALRAYMDAYNRHQPDAVAALLAPTVKWFAIDAEKLSVEGDGREAMRAWLKRYFTSLPDVRSEFLSVEQAGAFLSVRERASWTAKDGTRRSQQGHGVYEIRDGLITRVWYFPAVPELQAATPASLPPLVRAEADGITVERLAADLTFLSSDALRERATPSPGFDKAADYIVTRLKAAGVSTLLPAWMCEERSCWRTGRARCRRVSRFRNWVA